MPVTDILTAPELKELRRQYDPRKAGEIFGGVLPQLYPPATGYIDAVGSTLYGDWQSGPTGPLKPENRERCILTVLGSRQENRNLAIHIYLALMYGVSPAEIAHILVLAGIYSGISSFAHSIGIEVVTLTKLKGLVASNAAGVEQVNDALKATFPS